MNCKQAGILVGGKWDKMMDVSRRVYSTETIEPTLHTCGGGNLEAKIMEEPLVWDGYNQEIRKDNETVGTITRNVGADLKRNGQGIIEPLEEACLVRKLTEKECFRLQGVIDEDFERVKQNQSKSSLYHLAGDSITTSVLMALFGEMLGIDWRSKVDDLAEDLSKERNIKNDTY
jgi:DNA (cytosine-5)-methyltransferase 1